MTVLRFLRMAHFSEIDKATLNIHSIQLNMHPVTDIQTLKAIDQFASDRHVEEPAPRTFPESARDNRIETFPDP